MENLEFDNLGKKTWKNMEFWTNIFKPWNNLEFLIIFTCLVVKFRFDKKIYPIDNIFLSSPIVFLLKDILK